MVTIFPNITTTKNPHYISVEKALDRIKLGRSKERCEQIRACQSKDERANLKGLLPCVVFTGKFSQRGNEFCTERSKMIVLDFDHVGNVHEEKEIFKSIPFVHACWISPSGTGIKVLIKVSTNDHLSHFLALEKRFPKLDVAGKDIARVCYESYDPDIYINLKSEIYKDVFKEEKKAVKIDTNTSDYKFNCLLKWLQDKGSGFVDGNRNNFVFRLAAACNRIGMSENDCIYNISMITAGTGFEDEADNAIRSLYKRYAKNFGAFEMKENQVYSKGTNENVTEQIYEGEDFSQDTITFNSIWDEFIMAYRDGITKGDTTHVLEIDQHFRWMKGQINLLHGFGNFGKSTMLMQLALIKSLYDNTKWCFFTPEQMPATFFYRDLVQMLLGKTINNRLSNHITLTELNNIKEFVHEHFIITYPKKNNPTPEYIMDRLFENVITNKIDSCVIDPWNQLVHKWGARDDHYLETHLTKFKLFTKQNNVYFTITTHPTNPKTPDANFDMPMPDVWNISGGGMWNAIMDNILCYHRPKHHIDKSAPDCQFASQKIRFQQMNGIPGIVNMIFEREKFRFYFNGSSPLENEFVRNKLEVKTTSLFSNDAMQPSKKFYDDPREDLPF